MDKVKTTRFLFILLVSLLMVFPAEARMIGFDELLGRERPEPTKRIAYGPGQNQFGDLWLPTAPGPHPTVVMIHGGCWQESLPGVELMAYIADDLRQSGIAVWNIEYRRLGAHGAGYPGTFQDVANGIDYLRQISVTYNLDLTHIMVVGHSAGGHLALWAAARPRLSPQSILHTENPLPVSSVITLAGINDLQAYRDQGPSACGGPDTIDNLILAPGHSGVDAYKDTSPQAMLPMAVDQVIVSGSEDPIVPARFGEAYVHAAHAAGDKAELIDALGAGHFDLIDPRSEAWIKIKSALLGRLQTR